MQGVRRHVSEGSRRSEGEALAEPARRSASCERRLTAQRRGRAHAEHARRSVSCQRRPRRSEGERMLNMQDVRRHERRLTAQRRERMLNMQDVRRHVSEGSRRSERGSTSWPAEFHPMKIWGLLARDGRLDFHPMKIWSPSARKVRAAGRPDVLQVVRAPPLRCAVSRRSWQARRLPGGANASLRCAVSRRSWQARRLPGVRASPLCCAASRRSRQARCFASGANASPSLRREPSLSASQTSCTWTERPLGQRTYPRSNRRTT